MKAKLLILTTIHDAKFVSEDAKEYRNPCFKEIENFQRNYVHKYDNVYPYFVKGNPEQKELYVLDRDTLSVQCGVNRQGELKKKMLLTFEYFTGEDSPCKDWDFLLRGTTTCFKNIPALYALCKEKNKTKLYTGPKSLYQNFSYIRGDCLLMSRDVVETILKKREDSEIPIDDVFYGEVCSKNGIEAVSNGNCLSFGDYHPWFSPLQVIRYLGKDFCSARIFCKNRENDLEYHKEFKKKFLEFKAENILNIGEINIYMKNSLNFISPLKEATEFCLKLKEKQGGEKEEKKEEKEGEEEKKEEKIKNLLEFLLRKKVLISFFSSFSQEKEKKEKEELLSFAKVIKKLRSVETYRILYICKDTEFDLDFSMFNIDKICIGENLIESFQTFHKYRL